jgi:hypothetical protein
MLASWLAFFYLFYPFDEDVRVPCIRNFNDIWISGDMQNMLNDPETRKIAENIIDVGKDRINGPSVYVYRVGEVERLFYIPPYCYVEPGLFEPTLWRKND